MKGDGTRATKTRELTHCIEGSGRRQEGSATLIREAAPVPMVSAGKHGRLQEAVVSGKRCIVPMISAGKHGRLQRAVV